MTQNPFDAMGEGGFDMNALLQQAQQMQSQLEEAQQKLAEAQVEGSAGGVSVTVSGVGDLLSVAVTPGSFDGTDAESLTDLGDLVVAAFRDAKGRADAMAAEALGPLAGGLGGGAGGGGLPGIPAPGQLGF